MAFPWNSTAGVSVSCQSYFPSTPITTVPPSRKIVDKKPKTKGRLLVVANRLPMSMIKNSDKDGDITFKPSAGGLVSALKGVSGMEMIWIGWPGAEVRGKEAQRKVTAKLAESKCKPVFLDKRTADKYYSGFCNNVLWPSFHYIPLPVEALRSAETQFLAYERANELFAQAVLDTYEEGDTVWVHDYHLMLLPSLLRAARPNFRIGWFLHTPFPSEETFRAIPARQELLYGVLASDLIGFHTHDYVRHFLGVCTRIVGATCNNMVLNTQGWLATVGAFPIGITPSKFLEALERPAVEDYLQELKSNFEGRKILLGIDRLDYIKGIPHKLYALEAFLEKNPHWRGKVVLLQIAVPSRTDVLQYQNLKKETHRLVGRINGKFGSLAYSPVHYLDREVSFEILCALYRLADVMVISSLRDGMNLVAFEYIVCQQGKAGVLMLSEFAGAAQSLGAGAVEINPYSVYDFADAIKYALSMTPEQRQAYHEYAMKYVTTHTAQYWAQSYMTNLSSCNLNFSIGDINNVDGIGVGPDGKLHSVARIPAKLSVDNLVSSFKRSKHRLIITGLSSLTKHRINEDGRFFDSNMSSASHALVQSIRLLSSDPDTTFLIVTSKPRQACIKLLGNTDCWLAAENGFFLRRGRGKKQKEQLRRTVERWEKRLLQERKKQEKKKDVSQSKDAINNNRNTSTKDGDSSSNSDHFEGDSDSAAVVMSRRLRLQTLINRKPEQWKVMFENMDFSWREPVRQIFEYYAYRTPSTYITSADTHMSWHYRDSEITFAKQQVNDMISHLSGGPLSKSSTEVVDSHGMVQIRPLGVSKGFIALNVINELQTPTKRKDASSDLNFAVGSLPGDLSEEIAEEERKKKMEEEEEGEAKEFDFVLCLGNFVERDEDMFVMLNYKKQQGSLLAPLPSPVGASVSRNDQQTAAAAFPFAQSIPSPTDIYNNTNDDHDGNEGFNDDYVMHSLRHHRLPKPAIAVNILTGVSVTAINTGGACDVQTEVALKDKNGTAPTALTIDTSAPVTSHEEFNQIDTNASARFKAEKRPSIADAHADVYASAYGDANTYYLRPKSPTNTFLSVEESQSASPSHTQSYLSRSRSQSFEVDVTLSDDLHVSSLTSRTNSDGRYSSDHIKIGHHKHGGGDDSPTFHDVDSSRPHTCVEKETNGAANVGDEGEDGNVINIARRPYAQHINPSRDRSRSVPYQIKLTKSIHNNSKRASCANHDVSIHRERSQTTTNALSSQQAVDGAAVTQQQHSPTGSSIQVDQGVNDNDGCDDSLIENNTDSEEEDGTHGESPVSHEVLEKRSQSSTFPLSTYRMDRVHSDTEHQLLHRAQSFDHDGHAPLKEWIGHVPRRGSARSLSRDDVNANLHNNQNTSKPIDSFSVHHRSASMSMSNLARVVAKRPQLPLDLIHPSPSHPSLLASGSSPTFTALVTPSISIPSLVSLSTHNAHNHPHKSSLRVDVHSTIHDEEEGDSAQTPGQSPDVMQRVDSSWSLATVDSSASTSGDSNEHSADRTNNHDGNDNHIDLIHNGNSGIDEGEIGVLANHSVNRSIDSSAISIDFRSPSPPLCDSPSSLPTIVGSSGGSSLGDDDSNDDYGRSVAREGDLGTGMLALSPPLESTDISYSKTGHQLSASKSRSIYVVPSVISPDFLPAGSEVDKSGLCDLYLDISVEDTEELGADVDLEWRPVDDSSTGNDSHMIRSTTHTHLHTHPHIPVSAAMTHGTKTQSDVGDGSQGSDSAMGSPSSNMDLCGTINTPAETKSSGNKTKSRRRQRLRHGSAYLHSQQQQHHHHQTGMSVQYYQNQQGPQPASQLPVADEKSVMDERRNRPPSRSPSSASSSSSSLTSSSVSSLLPSSSTASTTSPSSSSPSSSSTTTTVAATSTSTSASASATSEPKTRKTGGKKKAKKNRTRSSGRKNSARSHALKKESSRQKKTSAGPSVYTVSVGRKVTRAQAYINNSQAVEDIMRILAGTLE